MALADLGKRLRRAREGVGATPQDAGVILGLTARSIRRWEAGLCEPSVVQLAKLAKYYEVTTDYLIYGSSRAAA